MNTAPVAYDDTATAGENQIVTVDVLSNDTDVDGDSLSLTAVSVTPGNGSVSISSGDVRFNPGTDFDYLGNGQQQLVAVSYTVSDGNATDQGTLIITVTGTNNIPTVSNTASFNTLENKDVIISEGGLTRQRNR